MGNERLPESITRNEVMVDSMPEAGNHVKRTVSNSNYEPVRKGFKPPERWIS
jgi:hypothetical protein